jgi:D-3-phosphoglycerate dehydrogenase
VSNALNMPSITAEEAPGSSPLWRLAELLGSFAGQLTESSIKEVDHRVCRRGDGEMNVKALTSALLAGLMRPMLGDVNMVSAPVMAKERSIKVDEVRQTKRGCMTTTSG